TRADAVRVIKDGAASPAEIGRCWRQETPLLLRGGAIHWPAVERWTADYLARTLRGPVGVGCSRNGVFQTRTTAILRMDARAAVETIMLSSDPEKRYYLKNVPLRSSSFAPLTGDLGSLRMLPADATDVDGEGQPGSLFWMGQQGTVTPLHADPTPNLVVSI